MLWSQVDKPLIILEYFILVGVVRLINTEIGGMAILTTNSHQSIYTSMISAGLMETESTKAFATRLPAEEAEVLDEVVAEIGLTRSAVVRKAIRFYLVKNPDNATALTPEDFTGQMIAGLEK